MGGTIASFVARFIGYFEGYFALIWLIFQEFLGHQITIKGARFRRTGYWNYSCPARAIRLIIDWALAALLEVSPRISSRPSSPSMVRRCPVNIFFDLPMRWRVPIISVRLSSWVLVTILSVKMKTSPRRQRLDLISTFLSIRSASSCMLRN